eukprot:jgi/Botrbrau1/22234/Bobra.0610s0001.1
MAAGRGERQVVGGFRHPGTPTSCTWKNLVDIIPFLRSIPEAKVREMQEAVQQDRAKFMYVWSMDGRPGANKIILDNMCHFVGKHCSRKMAVSH